MMKGTDVMTEPKDSGDKPEPLKKLSELVDVPPDKRLKHQLRILDGLLAQAVKDKDYAAALKIFSESKTMLSRAR